MHHAVVGLDVRGGEGDLFACREGVEVHGDGACVGDAFVVGFLAVGDEAAAADGLEARTAVLLGEVDGVVHVAEGEVFFEVFADEDVFEYELAAKGFGQFVDALVALALGGFVFQVHEVAVDAVGGRREESDLAGGVYASFEEVGEVGTFDHLYGVAPLFGVGAEVLQDVSFVVGGGYPAVEDVLLGFTGGESQACCEYKE